MAIKTKCICCDFWKLWFKPSWRCKWLKKQVRILIGNILMQCQFFGGIGWRFCFDHTRSHPIDPINQQHNKLERVGTIHFFKHCLLVLPTENCCSLCIVPWSMPWQGGISATFYNILWSREEGVCVVRQSITVKLKKNTCTNVMSGLNCKPSSTWKDSPGCMYIKLY